MDTVLTTSTENLPIQMHRELGPFEHLLWLVDNLDATTLPICLPNRRQIDSVANLNAALLQSQLRHPLLRTAIHVNDVGNPEFIPSSVPFGLRVVRRADRTQWLSEVDTELALPFKPGNRLLMRVVLVQEEAVSELILAVHLSVMAGLSCIS